MNHRVRRLVALSLLAAAAGLACGHGMFPTNVPVDRLIANLTRYAKDHPDDAEAHYRIGRVHTLALETRSESVLAFGGDDSVQPAEGSWAKRNFGNDKKAATATPEQLKRHLKEAVEHLNKAIERNPAEARYRLTLACALEAGASLGKDADVWPLCPVPSALKAGIDPDRSYAKYYRERFESAAKNPDVADQLIKERREYTWDDSKRDAFMTLAFEHRDRPEYRETVRKLREADWQEEIEEQFFAAMCLALPRDGKAAEKPIWGGMEDWVSYEAASDFVRIVEARKPRPSDSIRLKVAREAIRSFDALPRPNAITPMVIDLDGRPLSDLRSSAVSAFDLDGTGRAQRWTWVKPDAGILVWDPERAGRITSGRQLFGSVSWWVFFDNGYQALAALDDNGDGELSGPELDGISVWFDRNSNGISDPGEVLPLYQLGIAALSCRATSTDGPSPANLTGMRTTDGRELPTFDWIATPVTPRTPHPKRLLPSHR